MPPRTRWRNLISKVSMSKVDIYRLSRSDLPPTLPSTVTPRRHCIEADHELTRTGAPTRPSRIQEYYDPRGGSHASARPCRDGPKRRCNAHGSGTQRESALGDGDRSGGLLRCRGAPDRVWLTRSRAHRTETGWDQQVSRFTATARGRSAPLNDSRAGPKRPGRHRRDSILRT